MTIIRIEQNTFRAGARALNNQFYTNILMPSCQAVWPDSLASRTPRPPLFNIVVVSALTLCVFSLFRGQRTRTNLTQNNFLKEIKRRTMFYKISSGFKTSSVHHLNRIRLDDNRNKNKWLKVFCSLWFPDNSENSLQNLINSNEVSSVMFNVNLLTVPATQRLRDKNYLRTSLFHFRINVSTADWVRHSHQVGIWTKTVVPTRFTNRWSLVLWIDH